MNSGDPYNIPYPHNWFAAYRNYMLRLYEQPYLRSDDRDAFLSSLKATLYSFLIPITEDPYQTEIIQMWRNASHLNQPFDKTLLQIEKCRKDYRQQQWFGIEYSQPYVPVADFVERSKPREITKFLIKSEAFIYFLRVVVALEAARKRGGLHEREERAILLRAKNGENIVSSTTGTQTGFSWSGSKEKEQITALYVKLLQNGFIHKQTSPEQFSQLFSGSDIENPVIWMKSTKHLLFLIDTLIKQNLLSIPRDLEKKRHRSEELQVERNRGKISKEKDDELRSLLHEINHWLYPLIVACFKNKEGLPYSVSQ